MSDSPLIFIAYFGPDKPQAVSLHARLRAAGFRPWCDAVDLIPGDLWDVVIPTRLREAVLILVLVSDTSHDGWYARAEIADAIARVRQSTDRWVIPVVLDRPAPDPLPYGLSIVAHVDALDGDFTDVVDVVRRRLEAAGYAIPTGHAGQPASPSPGARGRLADGRSPPVDVHRLVQATIRRRLDRDLLLSWLPRDLTAALPTQRSYYEQITSDLTELVQLGRLSDGQWAIAVWLRQAERLAGPFAEARVYRDALRALGERG